MLGEANAAWRGCYRPADSVSRPSPDDPVEIPDGHYAEARSSSSARDGELNRRRREDIIEKIAKTAIDRLECLMQGLPPEQFTYREINWDLDGGQLRNFDASFATPIVYRLVRENIGARFVEEKLENCIHKRYDTSGVHAAVRESGFSILAEGDGRIIAFMTVRFESWNRRAWISHLYVLPGYKKQGVGKYFIQRAKDFASDIGARGLWLETQNFNYPAIQFYLRSGFTFCGFDADLYDPSVVPGETAIYFGVDL